MKNAIIVLMAIALSACGFPEEQPSLGDSGVYDISCPNFMNWEMCVDNAREKECSGNDLEIISPDIETLERTGRDGRTVPVEGKIRHRTITIMCELDH
ncbi:MAG: hypothetical protein AAF351_01180 [Pseudomonadota bacterium]